MTNCSYLFSQLFFGLKKTYLPTLMTLCLAAQGWGQDLTIEDPLLMRSLCKSKPFVRNIGFPCGIGPVPLTPDCLIPQLVIGTRTTIFSGGPVEPSLAVNPKKTNQIIAAWQQGRISNGGALEIGIAYSNNGGKKWQRTVVPLQKCLGGITQRISDIWLSYAADGKRVYLCALPFNATQDTNTENQSGVVVTHSQDNGKTWSIPQFVAASNQYLNEPTGLFPDDDKTSITADRNDPALAYAVWDRFPTFISFHSDTLLSRTTDGGVTWSPHELIYNPFIDLTLHDQSNDIENDCQTIGNVVVGLPENQGNCRAQKDTFPNSQLRFSNDLLNFMVRIYAKPGATDDQYTGDSFPYQFTLFDIATIRSKDKGVTWDASANVITSFKDSLVYTGGYTYDSGNQITGGVGTLMRTGDVAPSYNVNPENGFLYVVLQTGIFRADQLPQIGLLTSRDGGFTWSQQVKVSRTPDTTPSPQGQAFTPFVAVTRNGYVGILYNDFRNDQGLNPNQTLTDAWLAIYREVKDPNGGSTGIGLDFVKEVRLSTQSYIAQNGPATTQGVMTNGDYSFLVAEANRFFAIYTKSRNGPFNPANIIFSDPDSQLLLDTNFRTAPFVSIVKP